METTYTDYLPTIFTESTLSKLRGIQDNYSAHFEDYVKWSGGELTLATVRDYFIYLNEESGFKPGTIRIKRQAVKKRIRQMARSMSFEQRARIQDTLTELDRTAETSAPKNNNEAIQSNKYLTKPEVTELLLKARSRRQQCFIQFLWVTGCRINELTGVKRGDCHQDGELVRIQVRGKGNKFRTVQIPTKLREFIRDTFRGEVYLFETGNGKRYSNPYISNQIKKLGKAVLRKSISAHSLRHSFATWKVRKGVSIDAIADYMGHSSPSITLSMYSHNSMDTGDLLDDYIEVGAE